MRVSRVSKRYARALFKEGKEKDKLYALREDLNQIARIYQGTPEFQRLITSPVIPAHVKKETFSVILEGRLDPITFHFVELLISAGRETLLLEVIDFFNQILDEHDGIVRGQVISVIPFSDDQLEDLKRKLDKMIGKNVILTQAQDDSLLGGFVVKINDSVIDSSLRNQLIQMGEYLTGTP